MSLRASRSFRPWRSMAPSRASWSLRGKAHRAWARVGPISPRASLPSAVEDSRVPMSTRRATHCGLRSSWRAIRAGLKPSWLISEQTTRASSSAVRVRSGQLARSSRRLCSAVEHGDSITTGMSRWPCSRHPCRRLKPSRTSYRPSSVGTTRMGSAATSSGARCGDPGRSAA